MALFRKRKMRRETATKQKYSRYFNRMKSAGKLRQALTYAQWRKPKRRLARAEKVRIEPPEFKTVRTKSIEKSLRRAGLTEAEIRKLRGKK